MEVRKEIYAGGIKIFRGVPSAVLLCNYFQNVICTELNVDISGNVSVGNQKLCKRFEQDKYAAELWKSIILETRVHEGTLDLTCWDRIRLRVQTPSPTVDDISSSLHSHGRYSSTLPIHRDTWASNVPQQLNWWIPLAPISAERTLVIYPSFFNRPVPNLSDKWRLHELQDCRRKGIPYPQLPMMCMDEVSGSGLLQEIERDALPIVIDPGDVLVFSGSHLHGSSLNMTDTTRFSSELRTIDIHDVAASSMLGCPPELSAPIIDGKSPDCHLDWYSKIHFATSVDHNTSAEIPESVISASAVLAEMSDQEQQDVRK